MAAKGLKFGLSGRRRNQCDRSEWQQCGNPV